MIKWSISIALSFILLSLVFVGFSEKKNPQIINLLNKKLIVPNKYLEDKNVFSELFREIGVEQNENTILLRIPSLEVSKAIPTYVIKSGREFQDDIEMLLTALDSAELRNYTKPEEFRSLNDLWYAENSYRERVVQQVEGKDWFKIYRASEFPNSFAVLRGTIEGRLPDRVSDFWVAHCLILGPENSHSTRCSTFTTLDNILIEFHVSIENLHRIKEIKIFVEAKINEWIVQNSKES